MTTPGGGRTQDYQKLASPNFIRELPTSETTIAEVLKEQGYFGVSGCGEFGFTWVAAYALYKLL